MRVLILVDEFFAKREQTLLTRLEVGLADEGVRVVHAMPDSAAAFGPGEVVSRVLTYHGASRWLSNGSVARGLARTLRELRGKGEEGPIVDVVHVFGGSAWSLGSVLARELEAMLVLEVWRTGLVGRAREFVPKSEPHTLFIAPDPTIERMLRDEPAQLLVRAVPWGVLAPSEAKRVLPPERSASLMMIGTGRAAPAFTAAFEGAAMIIRQFPDVMLFCDALAALRAGLWGLAKKLGVSDHVSLIEDLEGRRDLVLEGDVLLQPDASGEQRSITLDALGAGIVVVAAEDPAVAILQEGVTARLVKPGVPAHWASVLRDVLEDPQRARTLAASGRAFAMKERRASDHIRGVLEAYSWAKSGGALPFAPAKVR